MVMGERGMADMAEMEMPLPDNTLPMMTRRRPVRLGRDGRHVHRGEGAARSEAAGITRDPGWYKQPAGNASLRMDRSARRAGAIQGRGRPSMPTQRQIYDRYRSQSS